MAKNVSAVFKLQGTIENLTFVNSRRYKPHVRAKKYSKTPFTMPAALAKSRDLILMCNQYARPIFRAIRTEAYDGDLWSRMVSLEFVELKAGRPLGLECLKDLECNLQNKMTDVIAGGYVFSATVTQKQLGIYVQLHAHPVVKDTMPRTGYQLRFVAIVPDAANGTVYKQVALGPLTKYSDELAAVDLPIALPEGGGPCLLLMGIVPHLQAEGACKVMSDSGMKVVWVGDTEMAAENDLKEDGKPASIVAATTTVASRDKAAAVETTDGEKEGFMIVKAILRQRVKPDRIVSRKGPSCLAVMLDGDERKMICRLYLNGGRKYIGTFDGQGKEIKATLSTLDDIFECAEMLCKIVEKYDEKEVVAG